MEQEESKRGVALKIFNGLHQGACIPLRDAHYTVGKDDSCDFILSDNGIKPKHLFLVYKNDSWFARPADGKVFLDGLRIPDDGTQVGQRSIVTIGPVHLSLIDIDDEWHPEELPNIKDSEKQEHTNAAAPGKLKQRRRPLRAVKVLAAALAVLAVYSLSQGVIRVRKPDYKSKIAEIQQLLNSLPLNGSSVSLGRDGRIDVAAYAPNHSVKEQAAQKLHTVNIPMRTTIYAEDELEQMASAYLARMQYPALAKYDSRGRVTIKGFAADNHKIMQICEELKANVPGILNVQPEMLPLNEIMPVALNILKKSNLDQKLTFQPSPDGLMVSGELSPVEKEAWLQSQAEMMLQIKPHLRILENINYLASKADKPGKIMVPITGVSLGDKPYITLQGGRKCFEGGPLKAGTIISRITSDRIIVQVQGREYDYTY